MVHPQTRSDSNPAEFGRERWFTPKLARVLGCFWPGPQLPVACASFGSAGRCACGWVMAARLPLLLTYTTRPRQLQPCDSAVHCPPRLVAELAANGLELAHDTLCDGNCGLHGFAISLLDRGKRYAALCTTSAFKKFHKYRRDPSAMVAYLRDLAMSWLLAHGDDEVWDNLTVRQLAISMGSFKGRFADYVEHMRQDKIWIDALVLHALACMFKVDVAVWQTGMDQTLVGVSTLPKNENLGTVPLLVIAMVNDLHFWGVRCAQTVLPPSTAAADNGDIMRMHLQPSDMCDDSEMDGPGVPATIHLETTLTPEPELEAELALCKCLALWDPWAEPAPDMVSAMQGLSAVSTQHADVSPALRCMQRAQVMSDLLYEASHERELPDAFRYHATARYRLKTRSVIARGVSHARFEASTEMLKTHSLCSENIGDLLQTRCERGGEAHTCLDPFRGQPHIVRNWRILWRSLSPASRREAMLAKFSASLATHKSENRNGSWKMSFHVLGRPVCENAFRMITGISSWSLTRARAEARDGHASSLSNAELGRSQMIKNANKQNLYLDARQWLEHYAATHAEQSPISLQLELPAGRKFFYYMAYAEDRSSQGRPAAALSTFLEAWRCELPNVTVCKSVTKFTVCGLCTYLKHQLDLVPRSQPTLMEALKQRLGAHFAFQSAQRLAESRIEEICDKSQGRHWIMHIDKMDQTTTILPQVWSLSASPLMKLGARLVAGVIGSMWHGPRQTQFHVRTVFEDCQHGSNMQISAALLNLHEVARREGHLPEYWYVGADNTPKETKNSYFLGFLVWLLAVLTDTPLWSVFVVMLLVGHTHNALDRFFSRLSVSLRGHDYYDLNDMWHIVFSALKGFDIKAAHLNTVWDWKAMEGTNNFPRFHRLHHVHTLNIFRDHGGIYVRWKQYMTDEAWSRSILLVPSSRTDPRMSHVCPCSRVKQKTVIASYVSLLFHVMCSSRPPLQDGSRGRLQAVASGAEVQRSWQHALVGEQAGGSPERCARHRAPTSAEP